MSTEPATGKVRKGVLIPKDTGSRILAFSVILLAVAGVIVISYRPIVSLWNHYRAKGLAAEAHRAMAEREWKKASPLLMKAYIMNPKDPHVLRECAYYERIGAKNPVLTEQYLSPLITQGDATSEDRAYLGQALAAQNKLPEARAMLETLPASDRDSRVALALRAVISLKNGDTKSAHELLRRSLALEPDNPESTLQLALMDLDNPASEIQEQAIGSLWKIARSPADESLAAIEKLAGHEMLTAPQSAELTELLGKKDDAPKRLHYVIVSAYIRLHPSERESVLKREISDVQAGETVRLGELCGWLIAQAEYERVLALISPASAAIEAILYPYYVEALVRKKNWAELKDFLINTKNPPTSPIDVLQLRAFCSDSLKEPSSVVIDLLGQARQLAIKEKNFAALKHLAGQAKKIGYPGIAIECLRSTATAPSAEWKANLEQILDLQQQLGDIPGMMATLREFDSLTGRANTHAESLIYLKLISGMELETVMDECATLASSGRVSSEAHLFFKALDAFRNADKNGLKASLDAINPKKLPMNWRAVYAGMMGSIGERARAFQIAEKIPVSTLTEDERKIFSGAL